jgi:hypothetical protein
MLKIKNSYESTARVLYMTWHFTGFHPGEILSFLMLGDPVSDTCGVRAANVVAATVPASPAAKKAAPGGAAAIV